MQEVVNDSVLRDVLPQGKIDKKGVSCDPSNPYALKVIYETKPLLSHICEFYPDKMLRDEFIDLSLSEDDEENKSLSRDFYDWLTKHNITEALYDGLVRANIYGTYVVLIDVEEQGDQEQSKPLVFDRVKSIIKLQGVRFDLADVIVRDSDEDYELGVNGTYYKVGDIEWHESRVLRFDTTSVVDDPKEPSTSLLVKVEEDFNYYEQVHDTVQKITDSASVPVLGIDGLGAKLLDPKTKEMIQRRLALAKESIMRMGAIAIDGKNESFNYAERNLSGLSDIVQIAKDRLSAATAIPETFLFQRSSTGGGLSDSGLGERSIVATKTNSLQVRQLKTPMSVLLELWAAITNHNGLLTFEFAPTLELTRKEIAEIEKIEAETESIRSEDDDPSPPVIGAEPTTPEDEQEGTARDIEGDDLGKAQAPGQSGANNPLSLNLWGSLESVVGDEVEISGSALTQAQSNEMIERGVNLSALRAARTQTKRILGKDSIKLPKTASGLSEVDADKVFEVLDLWNKNKVEGFQRTLNRFINGTLTLSNFQSQMIEELLKNSLILANGFLPDDFFDTGRAQDFVDLISEQMTELIGYLNDMVSGLRDRGEVSEALIAYRVRRYIDYQSSFVYESFRLINILAGATEERRNLDPTKEHCNPCIEYARAGWVPIYTLPVIKQLCDCANWCACSMEFR